MLNTTKQQHAAPLGSCQLVLPEHATACNRLQLCMQSTANACRLQIAGDACKQFSLQLYCCFSMCCNESNKPLQHHETALGCT